MKPLILFLFTAILFSSCQTIDVFEKTTFFPKHEWRSSEKPSFSFEIKDTSSLYRVYFVVRHHDAYRYNNIWVNLTVNGPTDTTQLRREFVLATGAQGWLGSGMDDIIEHRLPFSNEPAPLKAGTYTFTLAQDMREDPLENIWNVGIRVDKVK